jgi:ribosome-associated heat shock protein Hsp15
MKPAPAPLTEVRADVWLWAARMFKTRPLAKEAIEGGLVEVNGASCKPAKSIRPGDVIKVTRGEDQLELTVQGLSEQRGPAPVAQQLYQESEASLTARAARREQSRLEGTESPGRPDKKGRRQIIGFLDQDGVPIESHED